MERLRQIASKNLTNLQKSRLRTYFNEQYANVKNMTELNQILGTNNAKESYEALRKEYNNMVIQKQNNKKKLREQNRKQLKEFTNAFNFEPPALAVKSKKPRVSLEKLEGFVKNWYKKNNKPAFGNLGHFEITLKSRIANVKRTFKFNHIKQFENWMKKLLEENEIDSNGNTIKTNEYDVFENSTVEKIKFITGGCNTHKPKSVELKSSFYKYNLFTPTSRNNNCFFACLNHIKSLGDDRYLYTNLRKKFGLENDTEISINDAYKISIELGYDIEIIDYDTNNELSDDIKYIVYKDSHYFVLESFEEINLKGKKTKRGLGTFDFETRKTDEYDTIKATNQKLYILQDTLCRVYYRRYKSGEKQSLKFITGDKSSARQFIDWLNQESKNGYTYNFIAHNGGRFDYYFFISNLTEKELLECDIRFRGTTIIQINYRGHLFKDSACFLTDSLKNLCKSFKVGDKGKITKFNLHGKELTSEQLCFYKDELSFNEFLDLQHTDKEFWDLYETYCLYDCISLFKIWEDFTVCINTLISKISPFLLKKCPLMSSTTIGSHSKKIIIEINKYNNKVNYLKRDLETFTGIYYEKEGEKFVKKIDYKKYDFLCNFKRGGISHSHQMGKHYTGITGVDIASQYPASLIYAMIPTGKSEWINKYDNQKFGFYLIKNLVFDSYTLKPVAKSIKDQSLNWATNDMNELYVDSYMLDYIIKFYGLKSFDVVEGLVSDKEISADKIFGKYIGTFYDEKKLQDKYKSSKDELYNEALRTTIKLYLNSLTGKLVENPSIHFSAKFNEEGTKSLNGQKMSITKNEDNINDWIVSGIMVYSYSKRLLFEYIRCLPNNSDDVIHIETDGIYFSTQLLEEFTKNLKNYSGDYPCMFGEDLGNLKIEKTTEAGQVAYFLGKKFYCITMEDNHDICRIKGIPQKTIAPDGSEIKLVDVNLYDEVYEGNSVTRTFETLKKTLFSDRTRITSCKMTREIKSDKKNYKMYVPKFKYMNELKTVI